MPETKVILKYKRECDSWLCPECDTENNISIGKCTVCGCSKCASATLLKQWVEADEKPVTHPPKKTLTPPPSEPIFRDSERDTYVPEEKNKSKIVWVIFIAIIIIGLIIAASESNAYAAYSQALNEFTCGNYETSTAMLGDISTDYKNASYVFDESKYQSAKQWYMIDMSTVSVYDYIDGQAFVLSKSKDKHIGGRTSDL